MTIQTLRNIKEAGQTPLPGSFMSRLHQDLDDPIIYSMRRRGIGEGKRSKMSQERGSGPDSSER